MTKFQARSFPLHSIFTVPFGPRPVFETPNEGGAPPAPPTDTAPPPVVPPPPAAPEKKGPSDEEARLLKENMEFKKRLKAFEGIDPDEVRKLVEAQAEAERKRVADEAEAAVKRGEFEVVRAQMVEQHTAAIEAEQASRRQVEQALATAQATIEDLTIGQDFVGSRYISENLVLTPGITRKEFGAHFDVEGGRSVAYNKPRGSADRAPLVDASGKPLGFDLAIQKLVETHPDRDRLLRSKQLPGAASSTTDKKVAEQKPANGLTGAARIAANLASLKPFEGKL